MFKKLINKYKEEKQFNVRDELINSSFNVLGFLYKAFKYFIYTCLVSAFVFSAQCQEQVNEICIITKYTICNPNYERVARLRNKPIKEVIKKAHENL